MAAALGTAHRLAARFLHHAAEDEVALRPNPCRLPRWWSTYSPALQRMVCHYRLVYLDGVTLLGYYGPVSKRWLRRLVPAWPERR